MPQISMEIPHCDGMTYGRGIDSLTGRNRGMALQAADAQSVPGAGGQKVRYYLNKTESVRELEKSLGLHAEVNAQFGLFGASAKFDFAESSAFNSYSVFLVARVEVENAFQQIIDPNLDAAATKLLEQGNVDRFREQFGDAFVAGLKTGGEFCAVLELRTESTTDQRELSAKLSGSYALAASGEVAFTERMREATSNRFLKVSMYQAGGNETSVTSSVDEILARVKDYAAAVEVEPVPYAALLLDYGTLDLPSGPNVVEVETARTVLVQFARQRTTLLALLNDVTYVRENQEQFVAPDMTALNDLAAVIADKLNTLTDNASVAVSDPASATYVDVGIPAFVAPVRKDGASPVDPEEVPDLVGYSQYEIFGKYSEQTDTRVLDDATKARFKQYCTLFNFEIVEEPDDPRAAGYGYAIFAQDPAPGVPVAPGSTVRLFVQHT